MTRLHSEPLCPMCNKSLLDNQHTVTPSRFDLVRLECPEAPENKMYYFDTKYLVKHE